MTATTDQAGRKRAAFAREDVEDARRGRPAADLADYARRRGLDFRGGVIVGAFRGHLPVWADYVFNAMTGTLPGGEYGLLQHELEELPVTAGSGIDMPGGFHDVRSTARGTGRLGLAIPFFNTQPKIRNEPFAANAVWAPATRVAVRVPEAALLPRLVVRRSDRLPMAGNPELDDDGLPGFRLAGGGDVDAGLRRAVFGGPAGQVLGGLDHPHVALEVDDGVVSLQRNGFAGGDAQLDALAEAACAIAAGIRAAALRDADPQPFGTALPAPPELDLRETLTGPQRRPMPEVADALRRAAAELGLVSEDPVALHRAFPSLPVPGVAIGVLRGPIPGAGVDGRLAWFTQRGVGTGELRGAALFPARPGAATPPGGVLHEATDMYAEVAGGIAACWPRVRAVGRLDARPLIDGALTTLRDLELAAV